jgi:hypothetical protein
LQMGHRWRLTMAECEPKLKDTQKINKQLHLITSVQG